MQKTYSRINWENYPSGSTPINESNLNKMDIAINEIDDRIIQFDTTKLDKTSANGLLKGFSLNEESGVITLTYYDGSTQTISSNMAKIAVNVSYDTEMQCLVLTMPDGTVSYVDMTELITMYEFTASDTIYFEIDFNGNVSAKIKNNSITEAHLQTDYLANIKVETANSAQNREVAEASAILAKEYAGEAKTYASQALTTTPDGYNQTVADVELLKNSIIQTTERTLYGSKAGGIKLIGIGGASEQGENPSPDNPQEIESVGIENLANDDYLDIYADKDTKLVTQVSNLKSILIAVKPNTTYLLGRTSGTQYSTVGYFNTIPQAGDTVENVDYFGSTAKVSITTKEDTNYILWYVASPTTISLSEVFCYETTDADAEYKPYGYSLGIKASGKNLLPTPYVQTTKTQYGMTFTVNEDYSVSVSGTPTDNATLKLFEGISLFDSGKVCFSIGGEFSNAGLEVIIYDEQGTTLFTTTVKSQVIVNMDNYSSTVFWKVSLKRLSNDTVVSGVLYPMIRKCDSDGNPIGDDTYAPYQSKSITIPLNEPLRKGDEIVVVDGVWGKDKGRGKTVLDGSEDEVYTYNSSLGTFWISLPNAKAHSSNVLCTHYTDMGDTLSSANDYGFHMFSALHFRNKDASTLEEWRAILAENPITVEYELATPTFEPFTDQTPFYDLESFDTVTYISTDSEVEPSIELKFAKTEGDAINLDNYNRTKLNEIRIGELMALQTELAAAVVAGSEG